MRSEHMRSLFLLGVYCYDSVKTLQNYINIFLQTLSHKTIEENRRELKENCSSSEKLELYNKGEIPGCQFRSEFLYLWYLICLYHDIGYVYENNAKNADSLYPDDVLGTPNNVPGIPYSLICSVDKYYRIRKYTPLLGGHPCVDHGIYGGMYFYRTLQQLHGNTVIQQIEHEDNDGLLWGKPIFDNYLVPAAFCIICHNIFTVFSGTPNDCKYSLLGLERLVMPYKASIILPSRHPFLFLLCMLDTIEPVKFFSANESISIEQVDEILTNCTICMSDNKFCISWDPKKLKSVACRDVCQFRNDTGKCAKYSCMRKIANNLDFLLSNECHVSVDSTNLMLSLYAWPA